MKSRLQFTIGVWLVLQCTVVHAGNWRLVPRFAIDQTATDNVTQTDEGKTGDFITNVTPGLSLRGAGARVSSDIDYNFRRSFFASNPQFDQGNHQLQGSTEVELVKDHIFLNTNSSRSQQLTDTTGRISRNENSRNGNRSDVMRFQVSPSANYRFGNWAGVNFEYSYDKVTFTEDAQQNSGGTVTTDFGTQNNSIENAFDLTLNSGSKLARTPISVTASTRTIDRGDGRSEDFKRLNAQVSYVFNRKFTANANAGTSKNDFQSSQRRNDGFHWNAGGTWTPSPRTSVSGNWGQQFFGNSYNVAVSHRHRRWNFTLDYEEQLRVGNDTQRGVVLVPLQNSLGESIFDPVRSSLFLIPLDIPSIRNEPSVSKSLRFGLAYEFRRGNMNVSFSDREETFQLSNIQEVIRLLDVAYTRTISPRLSWSTSGTWREGTSRDQAGGDLLSATTTLSYSIGPHTNGRLTYTFSDQGQGSNGRSGFTEHSLLAGLVFHF